MPQAKKYADVNERMAAYRERKRQAEAEAEPIEANRRAEERAKQRRNEAAQSTCLHILYAEYQKQLKASGIRPIHEFEWSHIESWIGSHFDMIDRQSEKEP